MFEDFDKICNHRVSNHVNGNYSANCMHSSKIQNGMTIELRGKKALLPLLWTNGAVIPMFCHTEIGVLFIHSQEMFLPQEAAWGKHGTSYEQIMQFVLT